MKTRNLAPAALAAALLIPTVQADAQQPRTAMQEAAHEAIDPGPAAWRDNSRDDLRTHWETLEGKPASSIDELTTWLNTDARSWAHLRGKVVLIDYWATWCGPCRAAIPKLHELYAAYHERGFEILAVHSARGWEDMEAFVEKERLPWAFAADPDRTLSSALGVRFIPSYFFVDRNGIMRVAGADRNKLGEIIEALLSEPYDAPQAQPASSRWPEPVAKRLYASTDFRGKKAPEFVVEEWITPSPETDGKVLLIDFWATWCGPCLRAIPELNELQAQFRDDLVVIGVSDEPAQTVRGFLASNEVAYPQAIDPAKRMSRQLGVQGIPHVIVVSTDGIVRWQGYPLSNEEHLTPEIIERILDADPAVQARRQRQIEGSPRKP